jgi:tetratricopeptide (TPR) repeat protein
VEEQRGDRAAAIHSHQSAIAMAPREEHFRLSLGAELLKYQEYQAAVSVFQQAAELFPSSPRIYVGLGMAFYFMEKYDDSVAAFLQADQLDNGAGRALGYLAATQVDNPAGPMPAALEAICDRAKSPKAEPAAVTWCSALLLRKAYLADDRAAGPDILRRLRLEAKLEPGDPVATCSLGQALEWTEQFAEARHWLEICIRLRPNSTEAHYRLSRVYLALGLKHAAAEQTALVDTANAERDEHQSIANTFADEMLVPSR